MYIEPISNPTAVVAKSDLLAEHEIIAVVDDLTDITELLSAYLEQHGFSTVRANSAGELRSHLSKGNLALVLLDINLPDGDGASLLPELKVMAPDAGVIMLTADVSLETAMRCLRHGADDYLSKPIHLPDLLASIRRILEKRRLTLRNRQYQIQLETTRKRIERLHALTIKMNTAYLSLARLDRIMQAILTGLTAREGLGFNRAFLALFDEENKELKGKYAMGPTTREQGLQIWQDIEEQNLTLDALLTACNTPLAPGSSALERVIQDLHIDIRETNYILLQSLHRKEVIVVQDGQASAPVPATLLQLLQVDNFIIAPLYSPKRLLGVIIVDHFMTREGFSEEQLHALESFASQASLAIEHASLHHAMEEKIAELEKTTIELHKNREMLIEASRYSTLGQMTAQLTHNLKNPITAIGGTARLLSRKNHQEESQKFFDMMVKETEKVEKILSDLSLFVESTKPSYELVSLAEIAKDSVFLYQQDLPARDIAAEYIFPDNLPLLELDQKLMRQALVHLIFNAIEAMPTGGNLTLQIEINGGGLLLSIRDTGCGINANHLGNVTDPFFTTKTVGMGLGLTRVRRIIQDHGGQLSLFLQNPCGVDAKIWLPISH